MNRKQKIVLWIGVIIFLWIGFNPHIYHPVPRRHLTLDEMANTPIEYHLAWFGRKTSELFCYWSMVIVVTSALIYTLKTKS